jgi:glutathione S-transferase
MLKLYCRDECPRCASIEEDLERLTVASEVVRLAPGQRLPEELPRDARLPVLVDGDEAFQGSDAILERLEEMEGFKKLWYKYQSDVCYCEE